MNRLMPERIRQMTAESARLFLDALCNDASLRAQYNGMGVSNMHGIQDFALAKGYVFTDADLLEALKNYPDHFALDRMHEMLRVPKGQAARTS